MNTLTLSPDEPLTATEREDLLTRMTEAVVKRGLQTPVLFFLEIHRPMGYIAAHGAIFAGPFLGPLLGIDRLNLLARFLAEPGSIDRLIKRLEEAG